jgi:ATP-binding cassette subfamily F protein uup
VFLVSHDRTFLDNVVTSTIAFEGEGRWREYEGGVQDWLIQSRRARELAQAAAPRTVAASAPAAAPAPAAASAKRKLSYKEQRELEALPERIAELEAEQKTIAEQLERGGGALYGEDPARAAELSTRHAQIEEALMTALERWDALGAIG